PRCRVWSRRPGWRPRRRVLGWWGWGWLLGSRRRVGCLSHLGRQHRAWREQLTAAIGELLAGVLSRGQHGIWSGSRPKSWSLETLRETCHQEVALYQAPVPYDSSCPWAS